MTITYDFNLDIGSNPIILALLSVFAMAWAMKIILSLSGEQREDVKQILLAMLSGIGWALLLGGLFGRRKE